MPTATVKNKNRFQKRFAVHFRTTKSKSGHATKNFEILPDFQSDNQNSDTRPPPVFQGKFRLRKHFVFWIRRLAAMRQGRLLIFTTVQNKTKDMVWRSMDLAECVVSFRKRDGTIVINALDNRRHKYRLKVRKQDFDDWIANLRSHRHFVQSKNTGVQLNTNVASKSADAVPIITIENMTNKGDATKAAEVQTKKYTAPVKEFIQPEPMIPQKKVTEKVPSLMLKQVPSPTQIMKSFRSPVQNGQSFNSHITTTKKTPAKCLLQPKESQEIVPLTEKGQPSSYLLESTRRSKTTESSVAQSLRNSCNKDDSTVSVSECAEKSDTNGSEGEFNSVQDSTLSRKFPIQRDTLPAPMCAPPSLFKLLWSAVGRDILQMSLPAAIMEPLDMLQVTCEELEYSDLIDKAIEEDSPEMRMAYVAAFAASRYGSTAHRVGRKPFSPLAGQTFEYHCPRSGWRFIAEQVSHRPPITAAHAEGRGWQWWQDCEMTATFGGSSLEAKPNGVVCLHLENWDETYAWNKVTSAVNGVVTGNYVIDHHGDMKIACPQTKLRADLHFKKMTKNKRGELDGHVLDENGHRKIRIHGNWTDCVYLETQQKTPRCIWRLAPMPRNHGSYYGMTRFAMALNEIRHDIHDLLPKTDSRNRPDLRALEEGRPGEAEEMKKKLEHKQRDRLKPTCCKPLWFQLSRTVNNGFGSRYQFTGAYWQSKNVRFENVQLPQLWL